MTEKDEYTVDAIVGAALETYGMGLRTYQNCASVTAVYPGTGLDKGRNYCAMGLAGEVGELLNKLKKITRDRSKLHNAKFKESIMAEMGDILWYWSQLCHELNLDPHDVALYNINKLKDRAERDTIGGDGDNR
jgi:NTP pyrophosphatase (non-canonical NTP hydrolase)